MKTVIPLKSTPEISFNSVWMSLKITEKVRRCKSSIDPHLKGFMSATHNCIILEVRLFHTDGNEALSRR